MQSQHENNDKVSNELKWQAVKLKRHFDALRPQRQWFNKQTDGNYDRFMDGKSRYCCDD